MGFQEPSDEINLSVFDFQLDRNLQKARGESFTVFIFRWVFSSLLMSVFDFQADRNLPV